MTKIFFKSTKKMNTIRRNLYNFFSVFLKKKDNYKGPFTFTKSNVKDVWICLIAVAIVDVLGIFIGAALGNFELKNLVAPSITTIIMAIGAGVGEETYYRCITLPIMMKNKPTYKRMIIASIMTAVFFGVTHFINMLGGASLTNTLWQVFFAVFAGLFFAALYLRTGNILLPVVFHFAHDVLSFMLPTQNTGVILSDFSLAMITPDILIVIAQIIVVVYLLRKSKWEDIKNTWEAKWAK